MAVGLWRSACMRKLDMDFLGQSFLQPWSLPAALSIPLYHKLWPRAFSRCSLRPTSSLEVVHGPVLPCGRHQYVKVHEHAYSGAIYCRKASRYPSAANAMASISRSRQEQHSQGTHVIYDFRIEPSREMHRSKSASTQHWTLAVSCRTHGVSGP